MFFLHIYIFSHTSDFSQSDRFWFYETPDDGISLIPGRIKRLPPRRLPRRIQPTEQSCEDVKAHAEFHQSI